MKWRLLARKHPIICDSIFYESRWFLLSSMAYNRIARASHRRPVPLTRHRLRVDCAEVKRSNCLGDMLNRRGITGKMEIRVCIRRLSDSTINTSSRLSPAHWTNCTMHQASNRKFWAGLPIWGVHCEFKNASCQSDCLPDEMPKHCKIKNPANR